MDFIHFSNVCTRGYIEWRQRGERWSSRQWNTSPESCTGKVRKRRRSAVDVPNTSENSLFLLSFLTFFSAANSYRPSKVGVQTFLGKVERKAEKARAKFEKRWNFSLVDDEPFEGRIEWEDVKARKSSSSRATSSAVPVKDGPNAQK